MSEPTAPERPILKTNHQIWVSVTAWNQNTGFGDRFDYRFDDEYEFEMFEKIVKRGGFIFKKVLCDKMIVMKTTPYFKEVFHLMKVEFHDWKEAI